MRRLLTSTALLTALAAGQVAAQQPAPAAGAASDTTAAAVVQRFVDAANARDAAAMAALVAPQAVFVRFPGGQTMVQGRESIQALYARMLTSLPATFHITVASRIVEGNIVIDQEHFPGAEGGQQQATWMYQVQGGLIQRAWVVEGSPGAAP